jgi:hypothetical protein
MTSLLFRTGTLALLIAAVAPANVSHRYARSEPRDQGRPHSRRTYCSPRDRSPDARTGARHRSNYCVTCEAYVQWPDTVQFERPPRLPNHASLPGNWVDPARAPDTLSIMSFP